MKFQNASQILKYIKETHALQNKDLATILNLSDSAISYIISERFHPEDLGTILKTFNFAEFDSPASFNKFIENTVDYEVSAIDFNQCTLFKKHYFDISQHEPLLLAYFGSNDFLLASKIYDLFTENQTNYIFNDFDSLCTSIMGNGLASRVRFYLLNMLEMGEELSVVKNVGFSLSSSTNKGFEIFNPSLIGELTINPQINTQER